MRAQHIICRTDADFARYALFFIKNRQDFRNNITLADALINIMHTLPESSIMLILDSNNQTIGWGNFRYVSSDYEPNPNGEIAFVDSVIIEEKYRSSKLFLDGFHRLIQHIANDNQRVQWMEFNVLASHRYLNRLYSKFALKIGEYDGAYERENRYRGNFQEIKKYLSTIREKTIKKYN
ncbi:GNAT family N-acetyltransferase [Paenibacillus sp. PL91]|uniref:GNAT family N-acetyltransferase n=1 Tax=Paenibacillus sp. PL91 TaxID=2729538 RepID=UPI00145F0C32|nr:GNAT family N-acetyltransferase [Paenibacillus sp. PL91]MBC9201364.1 GNAT family N-acetyltransferase [Paenibacillus sp. PL91]